MNAIYDLMTQQHHTTAYKDKMLHAVPDAPVMDRAEYILQLCADKIVMDIGCTGELHPVSYTHLTLPTNREV